MEDPDVVAVWEAFQHVDTELKACLAEEAFIRQDGKDGVARLCLWFASYRHLFLATECIFRGLEVEAATLCRTGMEGFAHLRLLLSNKEAFSLWARGDDRYWRQSKVKTLFADEPQLLSLYSQLSQLGTHLRVPIVGSMVTPKLDSGVLEVHLERSPAPRALSWFILAAAVATTLLLISNHFREFFSQGALRDPAFAKRFNKLGQPLAALGDRLLERLSRTSNAGAFGTA